jgi:hypothetical protein
MPFSLQHKCLFIHIPRNGGTSFRVALGIKEPTNSTHAKELNGDFDLQPGQLSHSDLPISLQLHHLCMKQIQMLGVLDHSLITESLKVAFVRNPWDKVLSAYSHYYHLHSVDFEDFIVKLEKIVSFVNENFVFDFNNIFYKEYSNLMISTLNEVTRDRILNSRANKAIWPDPHFFPQHLFIYDEFDNQLVDFIGRFENYEKDAQDTLDRLGTYWRQDPDGRRIIPHLNISTHKNYRDVYSLKTRDIVYNIFKKDIQTFDYTF